MLSFICDNYIGSRKGVVDRWDHIPSIIVAQVLFWPVGTCGLSLSLVLALL